MSLQIKRVEMRRGTFSEDPTLLPLPPEHMWFSYQDQFEYKERETATFLAFTKACIEAENEK